MTHALSTKSRSTLRRLAVMLAAATCFTVLAAGAASADTFNPSLNTTTWTWSNCSIHVGFVRDTHDGVAWGSIAGSYMNCGTAHRFSVQQQLTFNGVLQPGYTRVLNGYGTNFASVVAGGLLETTARCNHQGGMWGSRLVMSLDGSSYYALPNTPQFVPTGC